METINMLIHIISAAIFTYTAIYLIENLRKKKILIAEDCDFDRKILRILLKDSDVKLVFAKTYRSAANHLAFSLFRPHLAIIDKNLPDSDGAHLYKLCKDERVPVKMWTADEDHIDGIPDEDVFRKMEPGSELQIRNWALSKTA